MLSLKTIILNQGDFHMSEAYKELLIKQKESMKDKAIGYVMVVLALFCIGASVLFTPLCLIGTVVFGILSYVLYFSRMQVEYEYTYMDKEFRGPNRTTLIRRVASVNEAICQGCGACTVACPSGAMDLKGFATKQIMAEVDAICK